MGSFETVAPRSASPPETRAPRKCVLILRGRLGPCHLSKEHTQSPRSFTERAPLPSHSTRRWLWKNIASLGVHFMAENLKYYTQETTCPRRGQSGPTQKTLKMSLRHGLQGTEKPLTQERLTWGICSNRTHQQAWPWDRGEVKWKPGGTVYGNSGALSR